MAAAPSRRLTVVQLLPALESGGVERSTLEIAAALVGAGHRAIVVSAGGRLLSALEAVGAEHVALDIGRKSPLTLCHVPTLRELFARERADVVHARSRLPAWMAWRALRGMPKPRCPRFVTTVHGLNSPGWYSGIMTRGERVVCVSNCVREYVLRHYPRTDPQRLVVIPRGIDPVAFAPAPWPDPAVRADAVREYPRLDGEGPLLLLPGRGTRLKGHADALRLLAGLRRAGADARLWLPGAREAGRGDYIVELERLAATLGVAEAVEFTPPTARIAQAYAASDLVLQLSRKPEAFGRTVIEALSVRRPVLGWDHGGVGELLRELLPQGAVPAFDETALLARAQTLLTQRPALPDTLPYTLAAMQQATLDLYHGLIDE
ncbi:glycosyl transferase [Pseudoxanthomonas kalamensis DSM 18571]|uniref:glycosyltransferase n=1 Tax=Pseudoxanthomonas kalamensis TaxID=289483 RepID=UPI0013916C1B|nr:glycosyltransferase [Pseudoxanthomonas kalamensis]KAF1712010.1 glycosyl transferase [Pseudoxanthomonas kalamensis DSM 18571]